MTHARPHLRLRRPKTPPGITTTRRFMPRFHYELLVCGLAGHMIVGVADATSPAALDPLVIRDMHGMRWHRCVRCDSWLPLELLDDDRRHIMADGTTTLRKPLDRTTIKLPLRGRPLRDRVVLRLIAIDRGVHVVALAALAAAVLIFNAHKGELQRLFNRIAEAVQPGAGEGAVHSQHGLLHSIDQLLHLDSGLLQVVGGVLGFYAILEGVEAVGLWWSKRWAEYLTLIATALFLPFEIYELAIHISTFKIIAFVVNSAIVVYLLFAKRLFGLRGGHGAILEIYAQDVGWQALESATPTLATDPA